MNIDEIKEKLDSMINGGMACGEDVFRVLHCASQELDQYERLLERTRWIPVSERWPDADTGSILIYTRNGGVAEGQCYPTIKAWEQFRWSVRNANVTHWMPLPGAPEMTREEAVHWEFERYGGNMTTQDVIEALESHSPDDTSELGEAIAFAVMILEKDLAQRAVKKECLNICPICKCRVFQDDNFCVDCGQRLNWQKG